MKRKMITAVITSTAQKSSDFPSFDIDAPSAQESDDFLDAPNVPCYTGFIAGVTRNV